MKAWRRYAVLAVVAGVIGGGAFTLRRALGREASGGLPTAPARKGDFPVLIQCRGELKARRSVQVTAPVNVPQLRIVWLAATGSRVKPGEPVVRFDPSSAKQQLEEKSAELKQAQAALDQAIADARILAEQDKIDTATSEYDVQRARLEVSKAEIVSVLQAEESKVDLGIAERKNRVQKATVDLNRTSSEAKIASLTRARDKAKDEVALTEQRLARMEIKAPIEGLVSYLPNYSAGWVNAKPFKVGDQAWPGAAIAELPDLETLEMEGKIEEIDRGKLSIGMDVTVRIDSLPENTFPAKLVMLSPMTVTSWEWPPSRTFRGYAKVGGSDQRLRPSMNGRMDVVVDRIPQAISVPAKAVFTRKGKPTVFVEQGGAYVPVEVEVLARNPDEVAVKGLAAGSKVATVEPDRQETKKS